MIIELTSSGAESDVPADSWTQSTFEMCWVQLEKKGQHQEQANKIIGLWPRMHALFRGSTFSRLPTVNQPVFSTPCSMESMSVRISHQNSEIT